MIFLFRIFLTLLMIKVSLQHLINPRIINGNDADLNDFPFMAFIERKVPPLTMYFHECAGVIYDQHHILSTVMCIQQIRGNLKNSRVKIRMSNTNQTDNTFQTLEIADTILHEDYSSEKWIYDIGLIIVKIGIQHHVPAKLTKTSYPEGEAFIVGWGKTSLLPGSRSNVLQIGSVVILPTNKCLYLLSVTLVPHDFYLHDTNICVHSEGKPVVGFTGDYGGPIIQYINGEVEVIGLISWTIYPELMTDAPTVGIRVGYFHRWIAERIQYKPNLEEASSSETPLLLH